MQPNTCVIGGCVRNCGKYLVKTLANLDKIAGLFEDHVMVFYYDVSCDNTLEILTLAAKCNPKITVIVNSNPVSRERTQNIANARNHILREIYTKYATFEYFIMADCDDVCAGNMDETALSQYLANYPSGPINADWDCLSFNRRDYYDIWALSYFPYVTSCWHWTNARHLIWKVIQPDIMAKLGTLGKTDLFNCQSAFGGFAIYRLDKFVNCTYQYLLVDSMGLIPASLIRANCHALPTYRMQMDVTSTDCEHRSFHFQAATKNAARIRISPLCLFTEPLPV